MLAKVVAWGADRPQAVARLHAALGATQVLGLTTNTGFLRRLVAHPDVRAGRIDTELVDRIATDLVTPAAPPEVVAAAGLWAVQRGARAVDPWHAADSWRFTGPARQVTRWAAGGEEVEAVTGGADHAARARLEGSELVVDTDAGSTRYLWAGAGDTLWLGHQGDSWVLTQLRETIDRTGVAGPGTGPLTSPMPGTVLAVLVAPGDQVAANQPLVVVEAMKMEHTVLASVPGTVQEVFVRPGDAVLLDQALAVVES
jgi:acetyl-CoA/propionyl-CoA carboxylase biotin carboxyl carrier protein